jgi:hypothetical protein
MECGLEMITFKRKLEIERKNSEFKHYRIKGEPEACEVMNRRKLLSRNSEFQPNFRYVLGAKLVV